MSPVILLEDGRLRVPAAEFDREVGGMAHFTHHIGPEHPHYKQLRKRAVPEGRREEPDSARRAEQAELNRFLQDNQSAGDEMLRELQQQVDRQSQRRAS